jgi:hypothetical protein
MVVYGGFERGVRQNTMISYDIESNQWQSIEASKDSSVPQARAGHSAVIYNGQMYVFGGKDEDNEKLKDLWAFDFATKMWKELPCDAEDIISRSGHSA